MNHAFFLDTNPAMSLRGTSTRARTQMSDMTAEHAVSCLCYKLKHSVDESGRLDDAKQIVSQLNHTHDDVVGSRTPFHAHI